MLIIRMLAFSSKEKTIYFKFIKESFQNPSILSNL